METLRKPLQGVKNIVQFNWHFFAIALLFSLVFVWLKFYWLFMLVFLPTFVSVLVSYYVYDYSGLYQFNWLKNNTESLNIANINAGFDETSEILIDKFPNSNLLKLDFYNQEKHSEISIKRARKKYPNTPNTTIISTENINLEPNSLDVVFLIFAAHEIRNHQERIIFFEQIKKSIKPNGKIYVLEHLRDVPNFMSYTIGFFHFLSKKTWQETFEASNLKIETQTKINPFVTLFIITKNGTST